MSLKNKMTELDKHMVVSQLVEFGINEEVASAAFDVNQTDNLEQLF